MITTLDEAIAHAKEVASRERELYKTCPEDCDGLSDCRELKNGKDKGCNKCAEEHEQLAEWLEQLKAIILLYDEYKEYGGGFHYQVGRVFDGDYVLDNKESENK